MFEKKNQNRIIFSVMSICLFGIIATQIYWISTISKYKNSFFDDRVHQSMQQTILHFEQTNKIEWLSTMSSQNAYQRNLAYFHKAITSKLNDKKGVDLMAIHSIFNNFITQFMPVGQVNARVNFENISPIANEIFQKNNLPKPLDIAVLDDDNFVLFSQNKTPIKHLISSPFKENIFSSQNKHYTMVCLLDDNDFPNYMELYLLLSVSIVLIGFVMYFFGKAFYTIKQQKKVSGIKNDFINNMTHEFKTPISTISLACQMLKDDKLNLDIDKKNKLLATVEKENKRLSTLVESVLQTAILDKGDLVLKLQNNLNIVDICREVIETTQIKLDKKQGVIDLQNNAHNSFIKGDKTHLTNVLYNLLDNAYKYCLTSPNITIHITNVSQGIELSIQDNGIGISKEHLPKIFDKLYRVPQGDLHNVKGFGLGLSYVKSIIEKHHGIISVKSTKNKGTTFFIFLPFNH